jgi:hypothetical protein
MQGTMLVFFLCGMVAGWIFAALCLAASFVISAVKTMSDDV